LRCTAADDSAWRAGDGRRLAGADRKRALNPEGCAPGGPGRSKPGRLLTEQTGRMVDTVEVFSPARKRGEMPWSRSDPVTERMRCRRWPGAAGNGRVVSLPRAQPGPERSGGTRPHPPFSSSAAQRDVEGDRICPPSSLVDCPRGVTRDAGREPSARAKLFASNQITLRTRPVRPMRSPSARP
jgi:hypothetical protein